MRLDLFISLGGCSRDGEDHFTCGGHKFVNTLREVE